MRKWLSQPVCAVLALSALTEAFGTELPFRSLDKGGYSGIAQATNLVIQSTGEWAALWKRHQGTVDPTAPMPAVDFGKEMVVAVAMGRKPTGGYVIKIQRIETTPSHLRIFVTERTPGPGDLVTQAFTAPFHFVAVAKSSLKPDFVRETESNGGGKSWPNSASTPRSQE
jgi:hypothetical protein